MPSTGSRNRKIPHGCQTYILKMTLLKIDKILHLYISLELIFHAKMNLEFGNKQKIVTRRPYWKVCLWKSIGFFLWPQSICKLDLRSENHVAYRQTDGRTGGRKKMIPVYPPFQEPCGLQTDGQTEGQTCGQVDSSIPLPASLGGDINIQSIAYMTYMSSSAKYMVCVPVEQSPVLTRSNIVRHYTTCRAKLGSRPNLN